MCSAGVRGSTILVPVNFCKDSWFDIAISDKFLPNFGKNIGVKEMGLKCLFTLLTGEVFGRDVMSAFFREFVRRR